MFRYVDTIEEERFFRDPSNAHRLQVMTPSPRPPKSRSDLLIRFVYFLNSL